MYFHILEIFKIYFIYIQEIFYVYFIDIEVIFQKLWFMFSKSFLYLRNIVEHFLYPLPI